MRRWLLEAVLPLAEQNEKLIIAKRPRLWALPPAVKSRKNFVTDPAPISPQITSHAWQAVLDKLSKLG